MSNSRSSTLPPELAAWLANINARVAQAKAQGFQQTPQTARQTSAAVTQMFCGKGPELAHVSDVRLAECADIPLRLYDAGTGAGRPLLIYLHGGGHMSGSIEVYDPIVRHLALQTGCCVLSVDYRLAPEHPYPLGLEDCLAVVRALSSGSEPFGSRCGAGLILVGDSGGGALAATIAARAAADTTLAIQGQVLIYPSLDYTMSQPSVQTIGRGGYLLEEDRIAWYFDNYFQHGENRKAASPLFMPVAGLAPTLIFTGGFCPLRDEGYVYTDLLQQAGVACQHENYPDMIHAWLNLHSLVPEACERTYATMAQWLRRF